MPGPFELLDGAGHQALVSRLSLALDVKPNVYVRLLLSHTSYISGTPNPASPRTWTLTSGRFARSASNTLIRSSSAPQRRVGRAVAELRQEHVPRGHLRDDQRVVLVLAVVPVEQGQLLVAMGRVIGGIQVERDRRRQRALVDLRQPLDPRWRP